MRPSVNEFFEDGFNTEPGWLDTGALVSGAGNSKRGSRYKTQEAKEKNRQAQQRFRDKKRAEQERQLQELTDLEAQVERLQLDNERLLDAVEVKQRILAVRESMLLSLQLGGPHSVQQHQRQRQPVELMLQQGLPQALTGSLHPYAPKIPVLAHLNKTEVVAQRNPHHVVSVHFEPQPPLPSPMAALQPCRGDVQAPLPPHNQMGEMPGDSVFAGAEALSDVRFPSEVSLGRVGAEAGVSRNQAEGSSGRSTQDTIPWGQGEGGRDSRARFAGWGQSQPGGADLEAISLPQVEDPGIRDLVLRMKSPHDFMEAWRVWQLEVAHRLDEAEASGLQGSREMEALRATVDHMVVMFWYASHLKPGFVEHLMVEGAAPPDVAERLWPKVAAQVSLTPEERAQLQHYWNLCAKRVAQAEVTSLRWLARIFGQQQAPCGRTGVPGSSATAAAAAAALVMAAPAQQTGGAGHGRAAMCSRGYWDHESSRQHETSGGGAAAGREGRPEDLLEAGRVGASVGGTSMASWAAGALEISEAMSHLQEASRAKELAVKDFLGKLDSVYCSVTKACINVMSAPYFPDFLEVSRHVLYPEAA